MKKIKIYSSYVNVFSSENKSFPDELKEEITKYNSSSTTKELSLLLSKYIEPYFDIPDSLTQFIVPNSVKLVLDLYVEMILARSIPMFDIEIDCKFEINCSISEFKSKIASFEKETNDLINERICFKWKDNIANVISWDYDFFEDTYKYERTDDFIEEIE